jgi:hypothetical protein
MSTIDIVAQFPDTHYGLFVHARLFTLDTQNTSSYGGASTVDDGPGGEGYELLLLTITIGSTISSSGMCETLRTAFDDDVAKEHASPNFPWPSRLLISIGIESDTAYASMRN